MAERVVLINNCFEVGVDVNQASSSSKSSSDLPPPLLRRQRCNQPAIPSDLKEGDQQAEAVQSFELCLGDFYASNARFSHERQRHERGALGEGKGQLEEILRGSHPSGGWSFLPTVA